MVFQGNTNLLPSIVQISQSMNEVQSEPSDDVFPRSETVDIVGVSLVRH